MSMIEITSDVKNPLLSRREITCTFRGLSGKLKKLEAAEMISKQFKLDGKIVIPILLKNATGIPLIAGTFYVYEDENLAKKHLKAAIFKRFEKNKSETKPEEASTTEKNPSVETKEESK